MRRPPHRLLSFKETLARKTAPQVFTLYDSKKRTGVMGYVILLTVLVIVVRLFWLQIVKGSTLGREAMAQIMGENVEISPRGSIVDRDGEELAVSIISKSLYVDPQEMDDNPEQWKRGKQPIRDPRQVAAEKLAPVLGMKAEELHECFADSDRRFVWVKRTLEPEVAAQVADVIKENKLSGFHFQEESKRYYTKNKLAAQVLGFVGTDDKGLEGIEASLDKYIKGKETKQGNFFDARGNRMGQSGMNAVETPKMNTVYLTIDAKMQFILEKSLDEAIAKTHAASAAAILMNPKTGEILGMANRPTFDPNKFSQAAPEAFMNRSVAIIYEPGSVFKPIMGCAGLMEGVITPTTKFNDLGSIDVGGRRIRNWDGQGLGMVTFTDIIKYSLNTGMASLGLKLGGKRETEYAKKFGFGSPTGSDIPGEEAGILYNPDDMVPSDVATMGIGQGIAVSPLQMLRAICAIANGGELLKPYIVKKVESPDGKILQEGQKQVVRTVITPEVAEEMRGMMEKVVSEGGGKTAQIKGYKIAGKTGTAEKLSPNGGYIPGVYIASFVGFVPSDDPQYAMLIMLDSPKGAFYGSQVSAPIFRDTLQQILVAKGIQPSNSKGLPTVESLQRKDSGPTTLPQLTILDDGKVKLPNLAGFNMRSIAEILQQGKLSLIPRGSGISWKQKPGPGTILSEGDTVEVWFK
ncbi:MAG: peptidoglycan glycosyltransferase [Acidaminococcaceae bacterium]|nr:peptidoglycan glycosyltransferase [Acidaminococcaceae bacterium]